MVTVTKKQVQDEMTGIELAETYWALKEQRGAFELRGAHSDECFVTQLSINFVVDELRARQMHVI